MQVNKLRNELTGIPMPPKFSNEKRIAVEDSLRCTGVPQNGIVRAVPGDSRGGAHDVKRKRPALAGSYISAQRRSRLW
jgi:hypothetical protein